MWSKFVKRGCVAPPPRPSSQYDLESSNYEFSGPKHSSTGGLVHSSTALCPAYSRHSPYHGRYGHLYPLVFSCVMSAAICDGCFLILRRGVLRSRVCCSPAMPYAQYVPGGAAWPRFPPFQSTRGLLHWSTPPHPLSGIQTAKEKRDKICTSFL